MGFLLRLLANMAALAVATWIFSGISLSGSDTTSKVLTMLVVALIFGVFNAILKPIFQIVTIPIVLLTLGLFLLVLNGVCLALTARLVPGFDVDGFGAALLGALVVSLVSWLLTAFVSDRGRVERYR